MRLLPSVVLSGWLSACGGDRKPLPAAPPEVAHAPSVAPPAVKTGRIEGVVALAEGATLPSFPDPKQAATLTVTEPPAPCTPISAADLQPVRRDAASGGLSSIHLALTGMANTAPASPRLHQLRLENCRLTLPLLAARLGDSVRITNASGAALLPSVPGDTFMEAILAGQSRTFELKRLGSSRIGCNFGAYCGQTDLLVTSHSLYAVSDELGQFHIDGVPLDRPLSLHAWHPLFDESHESVTLTGAAPTRSIRLVVRPLPAARPAPEGPRPKVPAPDKRGPVPKRPG